MKVAPNPTTAESASTATASKTSGTSGPKGKRVKPAETPSSADVAGASKPEISSKAREMSQAQAAAKAAPDVREAKVAELKERIAAGKYKVDADAVADRMVNEHMAEAMPKAPARGGPPSPPRMS